MRKPTAFLLVILLLSSACAMGPNYKRPEVNAPQAFMESSPW